ncbi:phytanoyl-CoA dioxygenase family protein [Rhodococcus sp. USK13]|uniref:phytanoyl-CoA dioxygenase family protein n=1 Tax=Rhodococcus sp. USK13 TaxID=2806442 RepID=UPI001BCD817F|nr:phytanoyl-CoA dioxygenase family protein [Rhodococcus sp. USK13]
MTEVLSPDNSTEIAELAENYELPTGTVEHLRTHSWAPLPGLLSAAAVATIHDQVEKYAAPVQPSETEKWMTSDEYARVLRSHDGMAWTDDWFRDLALSPRLSNLALDLLDRSEGLFIHDMTFTKPGNEGGPTPFHQDFPFWPFDRQGAFTIWIALTDLTPDMGILQFMPGSHAEGPLGRFSRAPGDDIRKTYTDLEEKYGFAGGTALKAGDATVHYDLTVHGANQNSTPDPRAAYTLRYMPTDVVYTGAPHRHFDKFRLVPGELFADSPHVPHISR